LLIQGGTEWLTASSDHSQAVVLKVSKAVGTPLREALAQYAPETQFLLLETHIFNANA
jgi:hypothetical protein